MSQANLDTLAQSLLVVAYIELGGNFHGRAGQLPGKTRYSS
ncbi:hypothetical protein QUB47_11995 [Microcoleus sp. AT9_B5]